MNYDNPLFSTTNRIFCLRVPEDVVDIEGRLTYLRFRYYEQYRIYKRFKNNVFPIHLRPKSSTKFPSMLLYHEKEDSTKFERFQVYKDLAEKINFDNFVDVWDQKIFHEKCPNGDYYKVIYLDTHGDIDLFEINRIIRKVNTVSDVVLNPCVLLSQHDFKRITHD